MDMEFQTARGVSRSLHVRRRPAAANSQHIDVSDPAQIARWCREFGCTWLELFSAVDRAGTSVSEVRAALRAYAYR